MIPTTQALTPGTYPVGSPESAERMLAAAGWEWDLVGEYSTDRGEWSHPEHPELAAYIGYRRARGFVVVVEESEDYEVVDG